MFPGMTDMPRIKLSGDDLVAYDECTFFDDLPGVWLKLAIALFGPVDGIAILHDLAPQIRARPAPERWGGYVGTARDLLRFAWVLELERVVDMGRLSL
jgi:hypothetical protein